MGYTPLLRRSLMASASLFLLAGMAHADLKVVQKSKIDGPNMGALGGGAAGAGAAAKVGDMVTTTYYKGSKVRVEDATGISITDNEAGTLTKLDLKKKTYSTIKLAELSKSAEGQANPLLEMFEMKVKADVKAGGHEKVMAGKKASDWLWTATIGMAMKGGDGGAEGTEVANISIEGEQWTSEEVKAPTAKTPTAGLPGLSGPGLGGMMGMMMKNAQMKAVTEKMSVIKGFPLTMSMKMTIKSPFAEAQGLDVSKPIVVTNETTTLSEEDLPDTLFTVPAGFKKVPFEMPQLPVPGIGG